MFLVPSFQRLFPDNMKPETRNQKLRVRTNDASRDRAASELVSLKAQQQAWEAFAACAVSIIPVLKKQMEAVTHQTERAAVDLMVHISALALPGTAPSPTDTSANMSKIVMAMQFQDITQQKLEHVTQALEQWQKHLQALLKGPEDESAKQEIAALQRLEESYTMEEERRLHVAALSPDYQEPVPIEADEADAESDSVTLF
jgi:ABC-type multidrug transport system fused ATPase/permease subunit